MQWVDVHVYGAPDWELPSALSITVHRSTDAEVRDHWFDVFDGEDRHKAALVSEERDPGEFYGLWTDEPALVDEFLAYLRGGHTPVSPPATEPAGAD